MTQSGPARISVRALVILFAATAFLAIGLSGCDLFYTVGATFYHVSYDGAGNTGGAAPADGSGYKNGEVVSVLGNPGNLTRPGMEFVGWGSQPGNYGINYRAGSTFLMGKADIVLYAKWYYSSEMQMASVAAGSFRMGILGFSNATPDHAVTLPAFLIGKYEVTQYQFQAITGTNPSWFQGGVDASLRPVEMVSWFDAIEFCNLLSLNDGYEAVYAIAGRTPASGYPITAATVTQNRTKNGYRLPTEAEWEYAAKGGNGSPGRYTYSGSDDADSVGWYLANSLKTTHSVGSKLGNGLGIFDMSGNVLEWCWDRYDSYPSDEQSDPEGPVTGDRRILRGGEWAYSAGNLVTTWRTILWPDLFGNGFGFRVVRRP